MSIKDTLKDIFKRDFNFNVKQDAPVQPTDSFISITTGEEPAPKKAKDHLKSYREISWIYKAVKKNAEKVAGIDLRLMEHQADGEPEEIVEHEMLELLAHVNDFMTMDQLIMMTQGYLELVGEAYWVKVREGGTIKELWPLRPDLVSVKKSKDEFISGYVYKPRVDTEVTFEPEDIVYFKEFDPLNPFRGMGAVMAAAYAGDSDLFAAKWNRNFFFNSAVPLMAILMKDTIGDESLKRFRQYWNNEYKGAKKSHKTAILKGVEKILTDLQRTHKDMGFLDLRKFNRDEIIAIFGVPRTVMGITDDVNRANAEATTKAWLEHEIKPKMKRFIGSLNEFLVRDFDENQELFFDFVDPVPENLEHKLEVKKAQGIPWMTINEMRIDDGLEPLETEEADKIFIPFNVNPIETVQPQERSFKSGLGKTPFKKKRLATKHKVMKVLKHHKKDFVNTMGSMMKNGRKALTDSQKESAWKQMIQIADAFEERYIDTLRSLFNEQEEAVLRRLRDGRFKMLTKQNEPFVLSEWIVNFKDEFNPLIVQLIVSQGQRATDLTSNETFDGKTERIKDFIQSDGLEFVTLVNETTRDNLRNVISEGVDEGEGIDELAERVAGVYEDARGPRSENIARTEVIRASNFAEVEAYEQDETIKKYEWLTSLDDRVCPWCESMDGEIIEKGSTFFEKGDELTVDGSTLEFAKYDVVAPPLHPRCRCSTIPVIE